MTIPQEFNRYPGVWCGWCDQSFDYYDGYDSNDPLCEPCNKLRQNMKKNLTEIFSEIGHFGNDIGCNDKNSTHTYLETYDRLFEPFRNGLVINEKQGRATEILEIGLALGDSIRLWNKYFSGCEIYGMDISIVFDRSTIEPENDNEIYILEGDATNEDTFERLLGGHTFDIVIDDGSHMEHDQVATFEILKHKMKPGGLYIIEDILAIDQNRKRFEKLHDNCEVIDMRHVNGRFDNVLIVYRF